MDLSPSQAQGRDFGKAALGLRKTALESSAKSLRVSGKKLFRLDHLI